MIEHDIVGDGPTTLLLVHGSPGNAQVWRGIAEKLAPRFRPLLPTLPGHGKQPADGATTLSALAEAVSYLAASDAQTPDAIGAMVDFWFGPGTFAAMPERVRQGLNAGTRINARDVRATFADDLSAADLAALGMPIQLVVGERSPSTNKQISAAIAKLAPHAEVVSLPGGTHAMPQTHVAQLSQMIEAFATT